MKLKDYLEQNELEEESFSSNMISFHFKNRKSEGQRKGFLSFSGKKIKTRINGKESILDVLRDNVVIDSRNVGTAL